MKSDPNSLTKQMWYIGAVFACFQMIVSLLVAVKNAGASAGGNKNVTFSALWSMAVLVIFSGLGAQIIFGAQSTPLQVGVFIAMSAMLGQLFFMLMVAMFILSSEAQSHHYVTSGADRAYFAVTFFNFIIMFVWTATAVAHKDFFLRSFNNRELQARKHHSGNDLSYDEAWDSEIL